jgi:hypothetical protein
MQLAEFDLQIALLRDLQRVLHCVGYFGEQRLHLRRRTQKELLGLVAHPLRIVAHCLRADADEAIVRLPIALLYVMHVIRRHALQPELLCPRDKLPVDLDLLRDVVVLKFQIKIFRAERLLEPVDRFARLLQIIACDGFRNFAGQAAGQRDQALLV